MKYCGDSALVLTNGVINNPLVTLAIPTFRRPDLLLEALLSAASQDTKIPFEVIVCDNDQFPPSPTIIDFIANEKKVPIKYFQNGSNLGMFGNWNCCVELASANWVSILNDDDRLDINFLSTLEHMLIHDDFAYISTSWRIDDCRIRDATLRESIIKAVKKIKKIVNPVKKRLTRVDYFQDYPHMGSLGIVFKKNIFIEYGGFDEKLYPCSDYYLFSEIGIKEHALHVNKERATYRILVNESIRLETAKLFIDLPLLRRAQLIKHFTGMRRIALSLTNGLIAINNSRAGKAFWKHNYCIEDELDRHGLPNINVFLQLHALKIVTKLMCRNQ